METKYHKHRLIKIGQFPGELTSIGPQQGAAADVPIHIFYYNNDAVREVKLQARTFPLRTPAAGEITWTHCQGLGPVEFIEQMGGHYNIHKMNLEDILHPYLRSKLERHENYLFAILQAAAFDLKSRSFVQDQISLILMDNHLITLSERPLAILTTIEERIRQNTGKIRQKGANFLFYSILDIVVDHYAYMSEQIRDQVDAAEDRLEASLRQNTFHELHRLRKRINRLHKIAYPVKEMALQLLRDQDLSEEAATRIYFRDLLDHITQLIDDLRDLRERSSILAELFFSLTNAKTNEITKILTLVSTIFLPLSFIAGIYGMNFHNMPELSWHYGYFGLLGVMFCCALATVIYAKIKRWF